MTETTRDFFDDPILADYDALDRMGKHLFFLAAEAISRGDRRLADDLITINAMPRREGQPVNFDNCEALGGLHARVGRFELGLWAAAAAAAYAAGYADILAALDGLARRRVCH